MTKFSRGFEAEADYLAVEYLYKTGYDPRALISFLERLPDRKHQHQGVFGRAFEDHPQVASRIKRTEKEIARILPPRDAYIVSTSEFDEIQSRLTVTESRRQTETHPTLKRRPSVDSDNHKPD
jgi:predicted Zn-dependent protease